MLRSSRRDVRNPVFALPAAEALVALDKPTRLLLAALFDDLAKDAQARAAESWRKHKAPMAAYWKCVAVYAGHIRKVLRHG